MCGRTFCAIDPVLLQKSCQYADPATGKLVTPDWVDPPTGDSYRPSYNIGPTTFTPVLLSTAHHSSDQSGKRTLQPMRWGLIPQWHKGDRASFKAMHNNCRGKTISEKSTFSVPFSKGKRCVVIAEGFYEWQTVGSKKIPYLFTKKESHVKEEKVAPGEVKTDSSPNRLLADSKNTGENNQPVAATKPLLFMAGIFDVCKCQDGPLYSYSIITTEAVGAVGKVHHRMPVILETDEDVARWLSFKDFPSSKVKDLITGRDCLESHQVTDKVNNVRYQEPDCPLPLPTKSMLEKNLSKGDLRNWFSKPDASKPKSELTEQACEPTKRKLKPDDDKEPILKYLKKE